MINWILAVIRSLAYALVRKQVEETTATVALKSAHYATQIGLLVDHALLMKARAAQPLDEAYLSAMLAGFEEDGVAITVLVSRPDNSTKLTLRVAGLHDVALYNALLATAMDMYDVDNLGAIEPTRTGFDLDITHFANLRSTITVR